MKIIDPGHHYQLDHIDDNDKTYFRFVKRKGDKYPGNRTENTGPISQEVIRMLIDRTKYVDNQIEAEENESVLNALRLAIFFLEVRAKRVRGEELSFSINDIDHIENIIPCKKCGHIECTKHGRNNG